MSTLHFSTTRAWLSLLDKIRNNGRLTQVRGLQTLEILGNQTTIEMSRPVIISKERKLGYRFMVAEAWWILTGQNTVETIKSYSRQIERFSDDGIYFSGAYGPKIVDQLSYIVDTLGKDLYSRQAVINIWRERPASSKDIPCTLSLQFLVRADRLNCIATMRSSDAWLGWVYDVFNFSMLSAYLLELLVRQAPDHPQIASLRLGELTLTAGSQHLYETDFMNVSKVLDNRSNLYPEVEEVEDTEDLIGYLNYMKNFDPAGLGLRKPEGFLDELFTAVYSDGDR